MKQTGISLGKYCAAFACSSRSYCFVFERRKLTGFSFFTFPKSEAEINNQCNVIIQNGKDGFVVKENLTYICSKHFHVADMQIKETTLPNKEKLSSISYSEYIKKSDSSNHFVAKLYLIVLCKILLFSDVLFLKSTYRSMFARAVSFNCEKIVSIRLNGSFVQNGKVSF